MYKRKQIEIVIIITKLTKNDLNQTHSYHSTYFSNLYRKINISVK